MHVDIFQLKNLLMYLKNYQLDQKYIIYLSGRFHGSFNLLLITIPLFQRYSRNQDFLSTEDLTLFLEAEQGVNKILSLSFFLINKFS